MEKRNPGVFRASCLYLLAGVGLWVVSIALAAFPGALRGMDAFFQMFLGSALCYLPFVLLPVMLVNRKASEMLRLNSLSLGNALRACAVALLTVVVAEDASVLWAGVLQRLGLNVFANPDPVPGNRRELLLLLANSAVLAPICEEMLLLANSAVLAPICEEMLFRGAMLSAWEPRGGKKAVWVTAILFAILHGSIAGLPMHLMAGVLLALLVLYTDSLYAGLIFHTVYNAGITLIAYYQSSLPTDPAQAAQVRADIFAALGGQGVAAMLIEIAIFMLILFVFMRRMRRNESLKRMLKANEGKQLPQMEYRELLRKLDDDSPACAKSDAQPLRTSTILVLMAGVASAIVRYIANILSML